MRDKSLRALVDALANRLRSLISGRLPGGRAVAQLLKRAVPRNALRIRPTVKRLLPDAVGQTLQAGSTPTEEDEELERPREADLPETVVRAAGVPVQRATVVAAPLEIAYNQFTQFEDFPTFLHGVATAEQVDETQVDFEFRRWGLRRRWRAQIIDQRPEERIAWRSVSGTRLAGVTTFHSIADRLTRIDANVVVESDGGLERIARRLRLVDRAVADELQRFKAFVEMREEETGAWRGYIADGEVVDEDAYFGWEAGDEDGGTSDRGSNPSTRSTVAAAGESRPDGEGSSSNGASAAKTPPSGGSRRNPDGSAGRRRGSKQTSGSRSGA